MKKDHLEILLEDMNKKFDLVLEGHAVLNKKIDDNAEDVRGNFELVNLKITALNKKLDDNTLELHNKIDGVEERLSEKIDAVAADLAEHRADTEKHKTEYKVSE